MACKKNNNFPILNQDSLKQWGREACKVPIIINLNHTIFRIEHIEPSNQAGTKAKEGEGKEELSERWRRRDEHHWSAQEGRGPSWN